MGSLLAYLVLLAVLVMVARGRQPRLELAVTMAGAGLLVLTGALPLGAARDAVADLAPTIGFLAAILLVAAVAERAGLFDRAGGLVRRQGTTPRRLVVVVAGVAAAVTVFLSLDATVVLFTPVVVLAVADRRAARDPALVVTAQVANAGSLLLPVSNLTNLLVLPATGLTFAGFAARMSLPTIAALGVVMLVGARRAPPDRVLDAAAPAVSVPVVPPVVTRTRDRFAVVVAAAIGVLLVALVVSSWVGIAAPVVAAFGAGALGLLAFVTRRMELSDLARATAPGFLVFVLALGVVVAGARVHGLGDAVAGMLPSGRGLVALLAIAVIAAVLANVVNNLPATLVLLTVIPHGDVAALLAVLVGVNVGPNLTYSGSLATLLWRRTVRAAHVEPARREFYRFGWTATPAALVAATVALWFGLGVAARVA